MKKKEKDVLVPKEISGVYSQIREVLIQARANTWRAVNSAMATCYWEIGRLIVEEEQRGKERAEYGKQLIRELARRLGSEFGQGFDKSNLWNLRAFFLAYPKLDAPRRELSWTHYRLLLRVEKPEARTFYEVEAANARWSTRELERQINSLLFERLALSRDKKGVMELASKGHEVQQREIKAEDENPPIGIILCTDKSDAVVRYTLPEGKQQIFASRYKLYLPTEAELAAELLRERQTFERERRISGKGIKE